MAKRLEIKRIGSVDQAGLNKRLAQSPYPSPMVQVVDGDMNFSFPSGIPAFEDAKEFSLLCAEKIAPFMYLESKSVEGLGFFCIDPFLICPDYCVNLMPKDIIKLDLKDSSSALVLSFVTVNQDPAKTTANLLAPIVINVKNKQGCQVILEDYEVQFNIWKAISETGDAPC